MKLPIQQFTALVCILALLGSGVAPVTAEPTEAESGGFDPSALLPPSTPPQTGELLAFNMNRVIQTQTQLFRYQATEYQRKVAEQRARAFVAAYRRKAAAAAPAPKKSPPPPPAKESPKKPQKPAPGKPPTTAKTKEPPVAPKTKEPPATAKTKEPPPKPKELPRYIAVDTVKDKRASPTAKKVVMIWDTHADALVGNNIYDVQNPPAVGAKTKFDTYSVEYIGAGL